MRRLSEYSLKVLDAGRPELDYALLRLVPLPTAVQHLGFVFSADCSSSDKRNKAVHIGCVLKDLPDTLRDEIAPGTVFTCPSDR